MHWINARRFVCIFCIQESSQWIDSPQAEQDIIIILRLLPTRYKVLSRILSRHYTCPPKMLALGVWCSCCPFLRYQPDSNKRGVASDQEKHSEGTRPSRSLHFCPSRNDVVVPTVSVAGQKYSRNGCLVSIAASILVDWSFARLLVQYYSHDARDSKASSATTHALQLCYDCS